MKIIHILFSLCVIVMAWACTKNFPDHQISSTEETIDYQVTTKDVLTYINMRGEETRTRAETEKLIIPVLNNQDTVMYIVNYAEGWELLSADVRMPKVLAMSDRGNLSSIESLYTNPAQIEYLNNLKNKITSLNSISGDIILAEDNWANITVANESSDTWTDWYLTGVQPYRTDTIYDQDHLMLTEWNQGYPWNIRTPYKNSNMNSHCYTGCTVVAACQVLYYLQDYFKVSVPIYGECICNTFIPDGSDFVVLNDINVTFDESTLSDSYWDLMPLSYSSSSLHSYTATLMTYMGYLLNAKYKTNGTSAATYRIYDAYHDVFGFDCIKTAFDNVDEEYLKEQIIDSQLPCILEMWNTSGDGHVVVLDGFRQIRRVYIYHYQKHNNLAQVIKRDQSVTEYSSYVAINWGWGGTNDNDSSGATIWYNLATNWDGYNDFQEVVCDFTPLEQ